MNPKPILLVEDNPDDEELTLLAFRQSHVANEVVVVRDGAEAVDYLLDRYGEVPEPEIILLDLNLPKISGLEILRRLKSDSRTQMIPVVVLTSSAQDRDLIESYRLGVNSYICKPVEFDRFLEVAKLIGMYWLLINQRSREAKEDKNGLNEAVA
jgi:two-component system response regulator